MSEPCAQMPCMTGPEAAAAFRAWERDMRPGAPTLPLIALTANVLEEHAAECKAAG
jgi:CheY-like chemotaxis protein